MIRNCYKTNRIKQVLSKTYHSQSLGVVGRVNGIIVNLVRTEAQEDQRQWDTDIPSLQLAINSAIYSSTEF